MKVMVVALVDYEEYTPLYFTGDGDKEEFNRAVAESLLAVLKEYEPMIEEKYSNVILRVAHNVKKSKKWKEAIEAGRAVAKFIDENIHLIREYYSDRYSYDYIEEHLLPTEVLVEYNNELEEIIIQLNYKDSFIGDFIESMYREKYGKSPEFLILNRVLDIESLFKEDFISEMKKRGWEYLKPVHYLYVHTGSDLEFENGEWHHKVKEEYITEESLEYWLRKVQEERKD